MGDEKIGEEMGKRLEDIAKGIKMVTEKVEKVEKNSVNLEEKLSSVGREPIKEEDEDDLDPLAGPDEIAKSVAQKVKGEIIQEIKTGLAQDQRFQNECKKWDDKAFSKFPDLKSEGSEFSKLVEVELNQISPIGVDERGRKILPPDAIWNAANRVAVQSPKFLKEQRHEELEVGGNFQRRIKGKEISEVQKELTNYYKSYGIKEENVKARIKSHNERKNNKMMLTD